MATASHRFRTKEVVVDEGGQEHSVVVSLHSRALAPSIFPRDNADRALGSNPGDDNITTTSRRLSVHCLPTTQLGSLEDQHPPT